MPAQVLSESTTIALAAIGAFGALCTTIATLVFQYRTHKTFNSKMDTMLELVSDKAYKQGRSDEKAMKGDHEN